MNKYKRRKERKFAESVYNLILIDENFRKSNILIEKYSNKCPVWFQLKLIFIETDQIIIFIMTLM